MTCFQSAGTQSPIYCFAGILMAGSLGSVELTAVNDNGSKAGFTLVITISYYVGFPTYFEDEYHTTCHKKKCLIKYLDLLLGRGAVLRGETGQAFRDFQNAQLAREGLPSRGDLLLAYRGAEKPGGHVQNGVLFLCRSKNLKRNDFESDPDMRSGQQIKG